MLYFFFSQFCCAFTSVGEMLWLDPYIFFPFLNMCENHIGTRSIHFCHFLPCHFLALILDVFGVKLLVVSSLSRRFLQLIESQKSLGGASSPWYRFDYVDSIANKPDFRMLNISDGWNLRKLLRKKLYINEGFNLGFLVSSGKGFLLAQIFRSPPRRISRRSDVVPPT